MQLQTNKTGKELKSHGCFEFPVNISYEALSSYERGAFSWHWHPEVELTLILEGEMIYQVNDQIYRLSKGDGLFCNTNALHTGHMVDGGDCRYLATTFAPRLLYGFENSILQTRFVDPLLRNSGLSSVRFSPKVEWEAGVLGALSKIEQLERKRTKTFEMRITNLLSFIWIQLVEHALPEREPSPGNARDVERLRILLDFIHTHYAEHLTLEEIAGRINICRSECCRFFKKHMKESLFDYLLEYRIEKSLPLLADENLSITDVAEQTGFQSPAYFSKIFKKYMACSPSEYRRGAGTTHE